MGCKGSLDDKEDEPIKAHLTEQDKTIIKLKKTDWMLWKYNERMVSECDSMKSEAVEAKKAGRDREAIRLVKLIKLRRKILDTT